MHLADYSLATKHVAEESNQQLGQIPHPGAHGLLETKSNRLPHAGLWGKQLIDVSSVTHF